MEAEYLELNSTIQLPFLRLAKYRDSGLGMSTRILSRGDSRCRVELLAKTPRENHGRSGESRDRAMEISV